MTDQKALKLIVEDATGQRTVVPVIVDAQGELTLGRSSDSGLRLNERNVSRKHAKLRLVAEKWELHDLGSYNGVLLNGARITGPTPIGLGDSIRIGDYQLELRMADSMGHEITKPTLLIGNDEGTEPEGEARAKARKLAEEPTTPGDTAAPGTLSSPRPEGTAFNASAPMSLAEEATEVLPHNENAAKAQALLPPFAQWLCLVGEQAGRTWAIDRAVMVIGRTQDNDTVIDHRSMSRHHARVVVKEGRYRIIDMDSANGLLVNDEAYTETELKHGDIAELGHVKLRFVAPGQQALLSTEEREEAHAHKHTVIQKRRTARLPIVATAALGLSIVGSYAYLNRAPDGTAQLLTHEATDPSGQNDEAHLMAQARQAIGLRNYARAELLAEAVLELQPSREEARQILSQCDVEKRGRNALEVATAAASREDWPEAYEALVACPKTSSSNNRAATLMERVRPALVAYRMASVRRAISADHLDEADKELALLEALQQGASGTQELRAAIEEARGKHGRSLPDNSTTPGGNGNLGRTSAQGSKARSGAQDSKTAPEDARSLYNEGTKLLNAGHNDKAIDALSRCVAADKNYARCHRALGIAYAKTGNAQKAVRYYRQYLKVDPQAKDASSVKQLLQQYESSQERGVSNEGSTP